MVAASCASVDNSQDLEQAQRRFLEVAGAPASGKKRLRSTARRPQEAGTTARRQQAREVRRRALASSLGDSSKVKEGHTGGQAATRAHRPRVEASRYMQHKSVLS